MSMMLIQSRVLSACKPFHRYEATVGPRHLNDQTPWIHACWQLKKDKRVQGASVILMSGAVLGLVMEQGTGFNSPSALSTAAQGVTALRKLCRVD